MAQSGSFSVSTTSTNDVTARIEWSESNVSVANNTSDLNVKLIYRMNASQYATLGSGYFKITVNGTAYEDNKYVQFASGTHEYTVIDHTFTITHDSNGAKSVSIVVNNGYVSGTSGLSATSGSGTATLTTIARATVPSAPSPCYFGSNITISMPRASSSFVHQLVISIGQAHIYETAANLGTSYTFSIPSSWADVCYNSTSSTLTIGCRTYSGSTQVGGTQVINLTIMVPDSWKPTVSVSKSISNGGDSSQVIAKVSTVNLTASGSASAGTGIASYSWSGGAVSGTGASKSHSPSAAGNYTYTVTVTDQRGRTGAATVTASAVSGVSSFSCAGSVNFGSALAVSISRIKSSFTHNVAYTINSSYTSTLTGQGTSASCTIPTSWAASVPAASAINMTVTVTTYNGNTSLGSTSKTVSVVVPSSWVPAFTLSTEAVSAFNSQYLKGVSKVKLTASSVSPSTGSQIASYSFTGNNVSKTVSSTATSYNVTSDLLTVVGTNTYTVKVTDKRGRVTTKTASITVVNYAPPTIKLSVGRYDSGGTADNFGGYGRMVATGSWVAVSGNSWTLTLKQKKKTASSYTTVNTWSSQTASAVSKTSDLFTADVDSAYDCQATITDAVGKSSTVTIALSTGRAIMDWFKDKVVGIFSTASETLRNALGNAATLLYSGAERTYLNGRVFVPKPNSIDGLTDGWRELNRGYIHYASGTDGEAGYVKICRIVITGTYMSSPIEIDYAQRHRPTATTLVIKFQNGNTNDPSIEYFGYDGSDTLAFLSKAETSTWDLYISKSEGWDNISIVGLRMPHNADDLAKITWKNEQVTTLPTGYIAPQNIQDLRHRSLRTYEPAAQTISALLNEVRYSNGAMGSFYLGTAYTYGSHTIPSASYNFLYIPHREGGRRREAYSTNCDYGNLFLYGIASTVPEAFRIRHYQGAVNGVWDLNRVARYSYNSSFISVRSRALVAMTSAPNSSSVASALSVKSPNGAWDICTAAWDNLLHLAYTTDTDYNAGTNTWNREYTFSPDGKFSGTASTALALSKTTFSVTNASTSYGSIASQRCVKMGNVVILSIQYSFSSSASVSAQTTILNIPSGYRPLGNIYAPVGFSGNPNAAFAVAATSGAIQVPAALINAHGSCMINMVYDV